MAGILEKLACEEEKKRNFVMISSAKAPFFLPSYLSTKVEAEDFLIDCCPDLNVTIIKPGVIVNDKYRWWSTPVSKANDLVYAIQEKGLKKVMPNMLTNVIDPLFPAPSTQLTTIAHFALKGIKGENE